MLPVQNANGGDDPNELGTDPTAALNFLTRTAKAHRLTRLSSNRNIRYLRIFSKGEKFERADRDKIPQAKILGYSVLGAITRAFIDDPVVAIRAMKAGQPPDIAAIYRRIEGLVDGVLDLVGKLEALEEMGRSIELPNDGPDAHKCFPDGILPCYKARPLNGIWATAPYLHNGSVRTVRQLLLPADQRDKAFKVGTREFDPVDIGFKDAGALLLDTTLPGNSNKGHDGPIYGNKALSEDPEMMKDLLEYLKTL